MGEYTREIVSTAAEVNASQHVLLLGVEVANGTAQPALFPHLFRLTGVPDIHGTEVGAAGFRIANPLNNGHLALVIELFDWSHGRVEPNLIIDGQHLVLRDSDMWPVVIVQGVAVRNNRIQAVVTPG
jgi:hypothetical protein